MSSPRGFYFGDFFYNTILLPIWKLLKKAFLRAKELKTNIDAYLNVRVIITSSGISSESYNKEREGHSRRQNESIEKIKEVAETPKREVTYVGIDGISVGKVTRN